MFLLWKVNKMSAAGERTQGLITLFYCVYFCFHYSLSLFPIWYILRYPLKSIAYTSFFAASVFWPISVLSNKSVKSSQINWLSGECWNITTTPDGWHSMISDWLIDPVSIHKTTSPIMRQVDRGRALTHEYSSDLRQEVIYHTRWTRLAWLTASGDSA